MMLALLALGCRQGMYDQAKYKPLARSAFFADGTSARPLPENTVPRGFLRADRAYWTGVGADGRPVDALPVEADDALLRRGRRVYDVFCAPCHDRTGGGEGMIVRRGYKRPPSFHDPRLREAALGHFVSVMTEGFGQMPGYAAQVPIADRWAVAAYLRALQRSHATPYAELSAEERARLAQVAAAHSPTGPAAHGGAPAHPPTAPAAHGEPAAPPPAAGTAP
jgi:mono/diheme cytochrome c family protein